MSKKLYTHTVQIVVVMEGFVNELSKRVGRPHEPVTAFSSVNGGMEIKGPKLLNLGMTMEVSKQCGVEWTLRLNSIQSLKKTSLLAHVSKEWTAPLPLQTMHADSVSALESWASTQPINVEIKRRKNGPVIVLEFHGNGSIASSAIKQALMIPRVVNAFATPESIQIWIAVESQVKGGLFHLACTNKITHLRKHKSRAYAGKQHRRRRSSRKRRPL